MRFGTGRKAGASVLLGVAVAVIVSGCNKPQETGQTPPPSGAQPAAKRQIAAILMQPDQFFRLNEIGMKDAAAKDGVDLLSSSAAGSLDKESSLVDTYAAQGVAAIIVSPINPLGSSPAIERAAAKGIKIITYNGSLKKPIASASLSSDNPALGASTASVIIDYVKKNMGGTAKVGLIDFSSQYAEEGPKRPNGFRKEIATAPGIQIVAEQEAWLAPEAERVATDMLNAHPEINIIWAANEGGTVGATTAVKNAGKAGKVFVFGTDMSDQLGSFLLSPDNILQAVTGQKAFEMGQDSVNTAVQVLDGKTVEKTQILAGEVYSRDQPEKVKAFQQQVQKVS